MPSKKKELDIMHKGLVNRQENINIQFEKLYKDLNEEFKEIYKIVNDQYETLKKEVKSLYAKQCEELKTNIQFIQRLKESISGL